MLQRNKTNGITLIALVITVIILLILAGVSIAMLTGENGILTQATNAKDQTTIGQEKEQIALAYNTALAEKMENQITTITAVDLETKLKELNSETSVWEEDDLIVIKFTKTGHTYTLEKQEDKKNVVIDGPIDGEITTRYGITVNGTNVTSDGPTKIIENETYTGTLTVTSGYGINHIVVTMGGTTLVRDTSYTYANNTLTIPNVSGNIEISVTTIEDTIPYLPTANFSYATGTNLDTGLVIKDNLGNSYVWIEVPTSIFRNVTSNTEYNYIEKDMQKYANTYRDESYSDTWYSQDQHGLTQTAYYELKNKMLKSIFDNGGFYIGQYEIGTETLRTSASASLATPVIKEGAYPYNYVTFSQAQELASSLSAGDYSSSLMFGIQWDLVMKYLEENATKLGSTTEERQNKLKTDSSSWGNYNNVTFNITRGKYSTDYGQSFTSVSSSYEKQTSKNILLTTGTIDRNSALNIYDLAGNVWELTLEYSGNSNKPCAGRGGGYSDSEATYPVSGRANVETSWVLHNGGIRSAIY